MMICRKVEENNKINYFIYRTHSFFFYCRKPGWWCGVVHDPARPAVGGLAVTRVRRRMELVEHEDSDTEEDPARLLNQWLGELNTLKRVSLRETVWKLFSTPVLWVRIHPVCTYLLASWIRIQIYNDDLRIWILNRNYQRMKEISEKEKVQYFIPAGTLYYPTQNRKTFSPPSPTLSI